MVKNIPVETYLEKPGGFAETGETALRRRNRLRRRKKEAGTNLWFVPKNGFAILYQNEMPPEAAKKEERA